MEAYWKLHTTDVYRLCFSRSVWNFFLGKAVPIDAHFIHATEKERAALEIYCDSEVRVIHEGEGRSYSPRRKSSRLALQEIGTAGSDRAPMMKKGIEERLREHGVRPLDLWNANRDEVNSAYRDAFEVLLAEVCDTLGAYTAFVFRSDAEQERIMRDLILPKSAYAKKGEPAKGVPHEAKPVQP